MAYKTAADLMLYSGWVVGTTIGAWFGGSIDTEAVGIGVLFPLLFLGLAAPRSRAERTCSWLAQRWWPPSSPLLSFPPLGRSPWPRWWRQWPGCSSVSDLAVVVAVAAITYGTRVAFLLRPRSVPEGALGRFSMSFPSHYSLPSP